MSTQVFKIGVVQLDVGLGSINANMEKVMQYLRELSDDGVSLVLLPEMVSCGFDNDALGTHAEKTPEILAELSDFAKQNNMAVAGSFPEGEGDHVYNTLYLIDRDGQVKEGYRKLHLFRLTDEHRYFSAGNRMVTVDTELGRIGLMICYDMRFPELARTLTLSDTSILLVPAQWPRARAVHWQTLLRARAIENQVFVLGANRTGADDDLIFPGLSAIIDPWGQVLAEAGDTEGAIVAEIDMAEIARVRAQIPVMSDRRKDIYG